MKGKKAPERSHFTIMISKGSGKVRSFRISSRMWFGCIIFLGLWFLISFSCLFLYMNMQRTGGAQKVPAEKLQEQLRDSEVELQSTKEHLKPLEESSGRSENGVFAQNKDRKAGHGKSGEKEVKDSPATVDASTLPENRVMEEKVGIQKFAISRNGKKLSVHFRLTNEDPSHRKIAGYVFAIAAEDKEKHQRFWSYPETPLKNGIPIQYKHGKPFSIKNYRTIRSNYLLTSSDTTIRSINILVYNETGKCILNREINTDRSSTAHPQTQG